MANALELSPVEISDWSVTTQTIATLGSFQPGRGTRDTDRLRAPNGR